VADRSGGVSPKRGMDTDFIPVMIPVYPRRDEGMTYECVLHSVR
jgi:hypothetical protein